jgi:hypothetical protein
VLTRVEGVFVGAGVAPHLAVQLLCFPQHILQQGILAAILAKGCSAGGKAAVQGARGCCERIPRWGRT